MLVSIHRLMRFLLHRLVIPPYHIKPNLLQMNASYVCSDPKGTVIEEVGRALVRGGYKIKVLNTIDFSCSMHYKYLKQLPSYNSIKPMFFCLR